MASYNDILKQISKAIEQFNGKIPAIQKDVLDGIQEDLRGLDLNNGKIKATVKNLSRINSIKNRLRKIILTDNYKADVKQFAQSFNEITKLQNQFWKEAEKDFKPRPLLREIKNQAIEDTVTKLMDSGIDANIGDKITDILRQNITSGGSYKSLSDQLREALTETGTPGLLSKYVKSVSIDSLNQFNANYAQLVSSDLGFKWYKYNNTLIDTSRPFCQSMVEERQYFHESEIPGMLRAENMYYTDDKDGERKKVPIYPKTGLPHGMIAGTDPSNFFTRRGGHSCGHQLIPVSEELVKKVAPEAIARVKLSQQIIEQPETVEESKNLSEQVKIEKSVHQDYAKDVLSTIDKVHSVTEIDNQPEISFPEIVNDKPTTEGAFIRFRDRETGKVGGKIQIKDDAILPELTLVHEIGHFLDFEAIGRKGTMDSESDYFILSKVIAKAKASEMYKNLEKIKTTGKTIAFGEERQILPEHHTYISYLQKNVELWARAYSQYVATKSTSKKLFFQLEKRKKMDEENGFQNHWDDEDFKPIMEEIDKAFKSIGWL